MKEKRFKPIAKALLKELGLKAIDIQRKNSKTPDFNVIGKNSRYTMELKIKEDDPQERKNELLALAHGELVSKSTPVGRRNRLYGIIKKAVQQIEEYDPKHDTFHIIWLHSTGRDAYLHNMRFHATLFGTQDLFSIGHKDLINCFYFHESIFFSCRDNIDGAILTYHDKAQLCVNTLSSRLAAFRDSDLYNGFIKGLCDPEILHNQSKNIMIVDCELDRRKPDKVISYLCRKYKLKHLQTIDMQQHSAMVSVRHYKKE